MDDRTGEVLDGRYRLDSLLGEGGMGQVYQGIHLVTGRKVAVKFLLPELADNAEAVGRFYREARAATAIGSEHICEVLDMRPPETGTPFLVMEFLSGETLKDRLARDGQLALSKVGYIFLQILEALHAAHKAGIVHRDIKPENVFLLERPDRPVLVKLLDFGISKFSSHNSEDHSLTRTGTVLGTPYYMSPEQASGDRDVGPLSDLYAVGVMLYEALAGVVPFDAESFSALVVKIVTENPVPLSQLNHGVSDALGDMVLKSMARRQAERFLSARDMAQGLRNSLSGVTGNFAAVSPGDESFSFPSADEVTGVGVGALGGAGPQTGTAISQQTQTPMTMERLNGARGASRGVRYAIGGAALLAVCIVVAAVALLLPRSNTSTAQVSGQAGAASTAKDPSDDAPAESSTEQPVAEPSAVTADGEGMDDDDGVQEQVEEAPPATVSIRFRIDPATARLALDGEPVADGPSAVLELPADGAAHQLQVTARGYREVVQEFQATEDQVIEVELRRNKRSSRRSSAKRRSSGTKRGGQYRPVTGVVTPSGWD